MPGTYCSLRVHAVFRTSGSHSSLHQEFREPLEPYVRGIVSGQGGQLLALGGGGDHLHLLLGMKPTQSVAEMMRAVKGSSSLWARARVATFGWAPGYSVFSVSASRVETTRRFIARQVELHRRMDFAEEHRRLLRRHGLAIDERDETHHYLKAQVVFGTKLRMPWITPNLRGPLYDRIRQIAADQDVVLETLGGIEDHVHLLVRFRPITQFAGLVKAIKGASSHWVNQRPDRPEHFGWQEGYAAFSVSASHSDRIKAYIENQEEHHKSKTFEDELATYRDVSLHG